jgi:hypothetical protein
MDELLWRQRGCSPVAEAPGGCLYITAVITIIAVVALLLGLSAAAASQLAPALRG